TLDLPSLPTRRSSDLLDAGTRLVTLQNRLANTAIDLGGADAPLTLGLTDAELDRVKAGTLHIGRNDASASGAINVSSAIDLTARSEEHTSEFQSRGQL